MKENKADLSLFLNSNAKGQELLQTLSPQEFDFYSKINQIIYNTKSLGNIHRLITKEFSSSIGKDFAKKYLNIKTTNNIEYTISNKGSGLLYITKDSLESNPYSGEKSLLNSDKLTIDNYKRDRQGKIKTRNGKPVKVNALRRKMNAFINTYANLSKWSSRITFVYNNWLVILIISLIVVFSVPGTLFAMGAVDSFNQTPFALCSEKDLEGEGSGDSSLLGNEKIDVKSNVKNIATKDFAIKAWIYYTKKSGWSKNATIGTTSYIIQEGSGHGTFTYEGDYLPSYKGPSGKASPDWTLDNDLWLEKLPTLKATNPDGNMIGLGLQQQSDVRSEATNATNLVKEAIKAKKYWQDPTFQIPFLVKMNEQNYLFKRYNFKSNDSSALEWCNIITGAIGMPAFGQMYGSAGGPQAFYGDHSRHLSEAESLYNKYKDASLDGSGLGDVERSTNTGECDDAAATGSKIANGTGVFPANLKGIAYRGDNVPKELEQFIHFEPKKLGLGWKDGKNWMEHSGQCVDLTVSLGNLIWGKSGIKTGNGNRQAASWASAYGGSTTKTPEAGAISSVLSGPYISPAYGHTYIVEHVFQNGDILIVEQNMQGYSGDQNGERDNWNYRKIAKSEYEGTTIFYTPPGSKPKEG